MALFLPYFGKTWIFLLSLHRYITTEKMKKVVRTVWICALSGLAFLAACCSSKGLTRAERKQLKHDRDSIQEILKMREMSAVYGSPEIIADYGMETARLRYELDSINARLGEDVDVEKSRQRYTYKQRLAELKRELSRREGACVYGSPEIIQRYGEETRRLREQVEEVEQQLRELDN
jgi:ubiquinone biosynthesis protein UbiJ